MHSTLSGFYWSCVDILEFFGITPLTEDFDRSANIYFCLGQHFCHSGMVGVIGEVGYPFNSNKNRMEFSKGELRVR